MSVLRGHILERSTELFNMKGFFNVSIQEIAKDLDISPGNFTYHFPKKEDLLLAIQQEIIAKASLNIFPSETVPAFTHLEELFEQFFEIQKRYSFFFSNLQYLSYEYPEVIQPYKEVSKQRLEDARQRQDEEAFTYYAHVEGFWMHYHDLELNTNEKALINGGSGQWVKAVRAVRERAADRELNMSLAEAVALCKCYKYRRSIAAKRAELEEAS